MRALAIETSGRYGSVAIAEDGALIAEDVFPSGLRHAAELIPRVDRLCRARGWGPADLAELYVSAGPGSFTGLRIGITFAKTLAFATGAAIVAVPTLEVLAYNAPADARDVLVVLDARRERIFSAPFHREGRGPWAQQRPAHLGTLSEALAQSPRPVYLIGEGIPYHKLSLPHDNPGVIVTSEDCWRAQIAHVVAIGHRMARGGIFATPDTLTPVYVRKPEAEEKLESQNTPC